MSCESCCMVAAVSGGVCSSSSLQSSLSCISCRVSSDNVYLGFRSASMPLKCVDVSVSRNFVVSGALFLA